MESAPIQALYEPLLAAKPQLREKPHQGLPSRKPALHRGFARCKSRNALRLQVTVVENGVGQTYSARYYNPATGRFLSRDPEDGIVTDPKTLHKYTYAGGDPVNMKDPTGREALVDIIGIDFWTVVGATAATVLTVEVACVLNTAAELLQGLAKPGTTIASITIAFGSCTATVKKCLPCDPPVEAGDLGYDLHIDQIRDHFDRASQTWIPGGQTHWHLFICNQAPPSEGCLCHWNKESDMTGVGVTPPGFDVNKFSCSGGGIQ
jgi:RHS repeat-associated protein